MADTPWGSWALGSTPPALLWEGSLQNQCSRTGQASTTISSICPAYSSRAQHQPWITEVWIGVSPKVLESMDLRLNPCTQGSLPDALAGACPSSLKAESPQVTFPRPWSHLPASAVLQASRNALLAIAELLKWKELKHVVKTQQTWRVADCLVRMCLRGCATLWALQLGLGQKPHSLEMHPCSWLKNRAPGALLQAHLPFLHPVGGRRALGDGGSGRRDCSSDLESV